MSPPGATDTAIESSEEQRPPDSADSYFLPDFCDPRMALAVVLVSELLALTFTLVRPATADFLTELARISVLMQWLGLTSAALLCGLKSRLATTSTAVTTIAVLGLVLTNILVLSVGTVWAGRWLDDQQTLAMFPTAIWPFALHNLVIGLIVTALLLRYFFVSHQWRHHVQAEARSRIDALQARIRPHFLFNSMNTIASLTRSDPQAAEGAVEDLADLFRATLSEAGRMLTLAEEFELTRIYQRIEMHRLGERLRVDWDVDTLPHGALIPGLTIQPLLENAIYHGIEPLDNGGTVTVRGRFRGNQVEISVINPVLASSGESLHQGQGMAIQNIRDRLRLAFDGNGSLEVDESDDTYSVTVRFPRKE
jgi:two-component system sensor histidine kinase AlgZ